MVDVGGQRSQRTKWFQCFDEVTSILFMVSSSAFDQVIMEDRKTNCLIESCMIFETIVNNKCFANVSIILFLNKTDLLKDKIKFSNISDYFPQFQGRPDDLQDVQSFILQMFDSRRRERSKALFHHFTTAIDTENIKFVFHAVKDTILQDNLKSLMLQWRNARQVSRCHIKMRLYCAFERWRLANETVGKSFILETRLSEDGSFWAFVTCMLVFVTCMLATEVSPDVFCFDARIFNFLDSFLVLLDHDSLEEIFYVHFRVLIRLLHCFLGFHFPMILFQTMKAVHRMKAPHSHMIPSLYNH